MKVLYDTGSETIGSKVHFLVTLSVTYSEMDVLIMSILTRKS